MNEPLRVLLFKGVCNYDHLRSFVDYVRMAFDEAGAITLSYDLARGAPDGAVKDALARFSADVAFSFNGDGVGLALARHSVTWMVDEPYYHPHWQTMLRAPDLVTLFSDKETCGHAITMNLARVPQQLDLAGRALPRVRPEAKDLDVLFAGSISDPEAMRRTWPDRCGAAVSKLMGALVERWAPDPSKTPIRTVFAEVAQASGVYGHPGLAKLEPLLLGEVNRYVRTKKRLDTVRALSDLPLTLVGEGWRSFVSGPRIQYRASVPFHVTEEMAARSKVALSVQPVHAHGASERSFVAMANEAVLVTNENHWLREHYTPDVDYFAFPIERPEVARDRIERLLGDASLREEVAAAARTKTLREHTWTRRVETLAALFLDLREERARTASQIAS